MSGTAISTTISFGVTLGTAAYASPLTITPSGAIAPSAFGSTGLYVALGSGYVLNDGSITGGIGQIGSATASGGDGGVGVSLVAGSLTNNGVIGGGIGGSGGSAGAAGDGGNGVDLMAGSLTNSGIIIGGAGGLHSFYSPFNGGGGTGVYVEDGSLSNFGTIVGGSSGTRIGQGAGGDGVLFGGGGTLTNAGFILAGSGGPAVGGDAVSFGAGASKLILDPGASFSGSVVAGTSFSNVLELAAASDPGTISGMGNSIIGFGTIVFDSNASWLIGGSIIGLATGQTIDGFATGDTIELTAFQETGYSFTSNGLVLSPPPDSGEGAVTIDIQGTFVSSDFDVFNSGSSTFIELAPPCFASGTRIDTTRGEVAVEALQIGDAVRVVLGDRSCPVTWIGCRTVNCAKHPRPHQVWPVRVRTDAFGPGGPRRDLFLSPDHAVYVNNVLIPIKYLINGDSIAQITTDVVTYYHLELPRHNVVFAEGLPVESYLDVGDRPNFASSGGGIEMPSDLLFDEACEAMWEAAGCAPLRIEGAPVDRVFAELQKRELSTGRRQSTRNTRKRSARRVAATASLLHLLDPAWYLGNNPDVAAAGISATTHYVGWGRKEGRLPCSEVELVRGLGLVDPASITFTMADVIEAGLDPVTHFCTSGWRERRRPNPYFETSWYLDTHEVPAGMNPLLHYVLLGEPRGLAPSRHFDPAWYRQRHSIGLVESPLAHYLRHRRSLRISPLPTFDVGAYAQIHVKTLRSGRDPYAHFLTIGRFAVTSIDQKDGVAA